jgi:hypothetical protein
VRTSGAPFENFATSATAVIVSTRSKPGGGRFAPRTVVETFSEKILVSRAGTAATFAVRQFENWSRSASTRRSSPTSAESASRSL